MRDLSSTIVTAMGALGFWTLGVQSSALRRFPELKEVMHYHA
jgi:hypothetical protein